MSPQQRIDPLSRLVGTSAPPPPAPFPDSDAGASVGDELDSGAPYLAPIINPARVAERSAHGAELHGEPAGDLISLVRDEGPEASTEESSAPPTTGHAHGRPAGRSDHAPTAAAIGATTAGVSAANTASSSPGAGITAETSTSGTGAATNPLEALAPAIDQARTFAERWEIPYRPEIFRVALGHLLGTVEHSPMPAPAGITRPSGTAAPAAAEVAPRLTANLGPAEKLARQLNVDVDAVDRALQFEDGRVVILARIDGKTRRELQIKYGLVLLYVKEIALATRLVDVEELRGVCVEHGCYDQGNFIGNFKKAQQDGFMREQPAEKGARVRRYMLTQKGMNEAAVLLRELVLE